MLFSVQNEVNFLNFFRKQNVESENFPINPVNVFIGDLRFFFVTGKENPGPVATSPKSSSLKLLVSPTPCGLTGRNKALRWSRETPPTGKSGGLSPLSFEDALLAGIAASGLPLPPTTASPVSPPPSAVRIVVRPDAWGPAAQVIGLDAEGWRLALGRKARLAAGRLVRRPPRLVVVDRRGRCFNCFSQRHRATSCRSSTWCFRCREKGHRSYVCLGRRSGHPDTIPRRLVWRPVVTSPPTVVSPSQFTMAASGIPAPTPQGNGGDTVLVRGEGIAAHHPIPWWLRRGSSPCG